MSRIHSTASTVSGLSLLLLALLTHPPHPQLVTQASARDNSPLWPRAASSPKQGMSSPSLGSSSQTPSERRCPAGPFSPVLREGQKQGFRLLTEPRHNTKLQHHFCKEGSRSRNQDLPVATTSVSAT